MRWQRLKQKETDCLARRSVIKLVTINMNGV